MDDGFIVINPYRVREQSGINSMGVTVRNRRVWLLYEPSFVCDCNMEELIGVLNHEVNHILFGHVFVDRSRFAEPTARIIAEEVTVNEWISEPLLGVPLTLDQFPELPPNEDTDTRYKRLATMDRHRLKREKRKKRC